jgi:LPS O-antigen subunit length determinant protein (WzzB/FepE family)
VNDLAASRKTPPPLSGPPSGYFVVVPQTTEEEVVDVAVLAILIARAWKLLMAATLIGGAAAYGASYLVRTTYLAEAVVMPVTQNSAARQLTGQLGGLASLAGIDLGASGGRTEEFLATLNSAGFARDFIVSENLLPVLFADRWDSAANAWRAGVKPPTMEDAIDKFSNHVRSIIDDRKTGVVSIFVEWYSPELAARWANRTVEMVNERLRAEAGRNADLSIGYLNNELSKTTLVGEQQAIYRLVEEQLNNAMVANVQREYAFHFIDHAVAPQRRANPKRLLITIMGMCAGLILGLAALFVMRTRARSRNVPAPSV